MAFPLDRRMSVVIGSGQTRYIIADVITATQTINHTVDSGAFVTSFYIDMMRNDDVMSDIMIKKASSVFRRIKRKYEYYGVPRYKIVATRTIRRAKNHQALQESLLRNTGFELDILSPEEENQLDYFSALNIHKETSNPMVWDISPEYFQLIIRGENKELITYKNHFGSVNFRIIF